MIALSLPPWCTWLCLYTFNQGRKRGRYSKSREEEREVRREEEADGGKDGGVGADR